MKGTHHITDVETLKAIAHPLRARLLGALRTDGPATANELARRFGESSGATSYHLRQLARYGFVEEHPEQRDRRERRWQAIHRYTSWRESDFTGDPSALEAVGFMRSRQIELLAERKAAFEAGAWSEAWLDAAGIDDDFVRLTPAALKELRPQIMALIRERAIDEPGGEQVVVVVGAFPREAGTR